jgi:hypothetical protein
LNLAFALAVLEQQVVHGLSVAIKPDAANLRFLGVVFICHTSTMENLLKPNELAAVSGSSGTAGIRSLFQMECASLPRRCLTLQLALLNLPGNSIHRVGLHAAPSVFSRVRE